MWKATTENMPVNKEKLQEQIKEQGEVVRKLKAAKESKEKVRYLSIVNSEVRVTYVQRGLVVWIFLEMIRFIIFLIYESFYISIDLELSKLL